MLEERLFTQKLLESEQMLHRIACAFLRSESDRQDAMQETALKAWQHRNRLREERFFKTWITRIMINECRLIHRKARRMTVTDTMPDQPAPDNNEVETRILHYLEGFSLEEIAQVQNISVGIVKYRMHQARKTLRVEWNGKEEP